MKKILTILVLTAAIAPAFAQTVVEEVQSAGRRGPYLTNRLFDNIFIGVGGGINIYQGENDSYGSHIAPALDISVGKWVTPSVGLRMQYSGLKAKGWGDGLTPYAVGSPDAKGMYEEKFNTMNLHADVLWNISNAIGGYKATRTWNFVPYVGFGWARSSTDDTHKNELAFTYGLLNNIRISNLLDINLEVKQMIVNQRFDGVAFGKTGEYMTTITAGLSFKLNHRTFSRPAAAVAVDYTPFNNRIANLEGELANAKANAKRLADELNAERNKPATQAKAEPMFSGPIMGTFFRIGSYAITPQEVMNLGYVAQYIKTYPDKKFKIVGYADRATGSAKRNEQLSQQRADAVYNTLVERFGVQSSQLEKIAKGGTDQFSEIPLNRVTIVE